MCGLYAKHPKYVNINNWEDILLRIRCTIGESKPCLLLTREITKGAEIVGFLTDKMKNGDLPSSPISLDDYTWMLSERLTEKKEFPFSMKIAVDSLVPCFLKKKGIYVGGSKYRRYFNQDEVYTPKISLHGDFSECSALIQTLRPKTVIVVHSSSDSNFGHHGDTELEKNNLRTGFIYPTVRYQYDLS